MQADVTLYFKSVLNMSCCINAHKHEYIHAISFVQYDITLSAIASIFFGKECNNGNKAMLSYKK